MQRETDTLALARVIGDVLDPFTRSINLRVAYNNREIRNGCDLRPSMVINQPKVEVGGDDFRTFYILVYYIYTIIYLLSLCSMYILH
ncbi:Protein HEADING DATE 3A [Capsicum annuum]|uniref:Protein HEADING DATE 3A n=1 Tax=Capsicum annuum TaxID=4072 RepID=A0A2G2Y5M8_CAPAN|nr:Protein HEADING DATE 3A [Capsicum annuum]